MKPSFIRVISPSTSQHPDVAIGIGDDADNFSDLTGSLDRNRIKVFVPIARQLSRFMPDPRSCGWRLSTDRYMRGFASLGVLPLSKIVKRTPSNRARPLRVPTQR